MVVEGTKWLVAIPSESGMMTFSTEAAARTFIQGYMQQEVQDAFLIQSTCFTYEEDA